MRQLKLLKKALNNNDIAEAKKLIDELIEDTQISIGLETVLYPCSPLKVYLNCQKRN